MPMNIKIKKTRLWVPAAGAVLAFGFFNNCILLPWLHGGDPVDWTNLILTLAIMLGLGGARDVVLRKYRYLGEVVEESKKTASKGILTNKVWIPTIGWCIVGGLFNNCCIHPFFNIGEVEWSGLLSALSILLTISGAREWGIYKQDKKVWESSDVDESADENMDTGADTRAIVPPTLHKNKRMPKATEISEV